LIASILVLIGQFFSGDGRCERADDLPAQRLIKIRDIETDQDDDSTMKPLMGMVVFSLPAPPLRPGWSMKRFALVSHLVPEKGTNLSRTTPRKLDD
jgi:hypothetical protein